MKTKLEIELPEDESSRGIHSAAGEAISASQCAIHREKIVHCLHDMSAVLSVPWRDIQDSVWADACIAVARCMLQWIHHDGG
jgi:hypothetical protein